MTKRPRPEGTFVDVVVSLFMITFGCLVVSGVGVAGFKALRRLLHALGLVE